MRILALQFAPGVGQRPVPRFDPALGTLIAALRAAGHEVTLRGFARAATRQLAPLFDKRLPELVLADITPVCVEVARTVLAALQDVEAVPAIATGDYAQVAPADALTLPGVCATTRGDAEVALIRFLQRFPDPPQQPQSGIALPQRGLPPAALIEDLDSLPAPARDVFCYDEYVRKTGVVEIGIGRGCPQRCTYCLNPTLAAAHADGQPAQWVRRRSAESILAEIDTVRATYQPVRLVRFLDHTFAQDTDWLTQLLDPYVYRCALPFRCHLRANCASKPVVQLLDDAGCHVVDVEVVSSSFFMRNEVFEMDLSNAQLEDTFDWLRPTSIKTRALLYAGGPYESDASLDATYRLLARLKPDVVDVRPYHPFPGTRAAELCARQGWQHVRGEAQYHAEQPGIDMPACPPARIAGFVRRLRHEYPTTFDEPWWRRWTHVPYAALGQLLHKRA